MQAVRAGDDHAFERLYHRYHRRISAYIFGMVHDHGRAEDLTQEVFVSALRRMRATNRDILFKPWIYEIAKNACIDQFRRSKRAEEVSIDADDGHGLAPADHGKLHATGASPEAAVEGKQDLANLTGAFGGLSEAHHQILVMRELEGLSYREIGDRLGMSRASVESTLFRARRRLTEEYEELRTGERCVRIQEIIGRGASAGGRLGMRDQRRVSAHVVACQPCRKQAVMAGLDAGAMARRPVRAKLAGLLPLPAFLKRRWLPGGSSDAASHGSAVAAKASMVAAQYGEPSMAGWMKGAAVATAVAVAGVGAGAADHAAKARGDAAKHRDVPAAVVQHGGSSPASTASSSHGTSSGSASGGRSSTHRTVASKTRTGASSHGSSAGAAAGSVAGQQSTTGASDRPSFSGSGSGSSGSSGSGSSGSRDSASTASAKDSGGDSTSGGSSATRSATPVRTAVDGATGAAQQATGSGSGTGAQAPLIDPNLGALTQPAPAATPQTPPSLGGAVGGVTQRLGDTVGGTAGQAVKDTGAALGGTVDDVTRTVTDTAGALLGGGRAGGQ
ncbi:RNA polymerase sigma factor [Conexibacter woesei]|uniref:RNA polymerase sigma factor n=1 Tax=Conexibacter woesei TaxID=191495 RepID=UPI000418FEDD|nr:sigma-70 family RNA polymerase sigma factor [Conexibacter woesei]